MGKPSKGKGKGLKGKPDVSKEDVPDPASSSAAMTDDKGS